MILFAAVTCVGSNLVHTFHCEFLLSRFCYEFLLFFFFFSFITMVRLVVVFVAAVANI